MPHSTHRRVRSLVLASESNNNGDTSATESTGPNDTPTPVALFDLPPEDPNSLEHVTGRRKSRSTERNVQYRATRTQEEEKRLKANDTRARNASRGARANRPNTKAAQAPRGRGRSRAVRPLSLSPSPGSTDSEEDGPANPSGDSQHTYIWETLDHNGLVNYARQTHNLEVEASDATQTILQRIRNAEAEQASQVGPPRRPTEIVILSPSSPRVSGGWSQDVVPPQARNPSKKRPSDSGVSSGSSSKRQRRTVEIEEIEDEDTYVPGPGLSEASLRRGRLLEEIEPGDNDAVVVVEDTATEPETDEELTLDNTPDNARLAAERVACPQCSTGFNLNQPPTRGTRAPPPTRDATPATLLDTQPASDSSRSLGDPVPPTAEQEELMPPSQHKLPNVFASLRGPAHARLRAKLLQRYLDAAGLPADSSRASVDKPNEDSEIEVEPAREPSQCATQGSSSSRTYAGSRSHVSSRKRASPFELNDTDIAADNSIRPNSPTLTSAQLIQRERARAAAAKARTTVPSQAPRRRPLFATASQAPASQPQSRPAVGWKGNAAGRSSGGPRRLDPVSAARENIRTSNEAAVRREANSFVENVTKQSERTARCAPQHRSKDDLLDDNEEALVQAEAYANKKWPRRSRVRKPKPLARDVSGLERQVLVMAKIHLFAYALVEGVYQTRATFLRWASCVHEATWEMELPGRAYEPPEHEILEIMVNNIATLRGKVKERLREFAARVAGFQHNLSNQAIIQQNLDRFNLIYPNSFHCKSIDPRSGDYESPEIAHCIALVVFHGPNSVGVLYPDYFRDMPLTVVAFALAVWQFCIEEWANGWRQNGDLGMAAMREKYESHLSRLKQLRQVAPRRLSRLQDGWLNYAAEFSGAIFDEAQKAIEPPSPTAIAMRPDTPEVEPISVEEMENRLLATAREASLREQLERMAAQELEEGMEIEEDEESRASTPRSCSPLPRPAEYNEHGVLTARSKGKGRAN